MEIKVGLDLTAFETDITRLISEANKLKYKLSRMTDEQIKFDLGIDRKQAYKQINDFIKGAKDQLKNQIVVKTITENAAATKQAPIDEAKKTAKETALAQKQQVELAAMKQAALDKQTAAEAKAAAEREAIRAREDRIYNDYLSHQDAAAKASADKRTALEQKQQVELAAINAKKIQQAAASSKAYMENAANQFPRLRYALYDVSSTVDIVGKSLLNFSKVAVTAGASYQSAFTNVERTLPLDTTNSQLQGLKRSLMDLAEQIPVTFQDLSKIATLGSQLGITAGDITGFTKTVAEFSATTNVTAESAALSFGTIGALLNLSAKDYEKFGSAVAQVGATSAATESEILSTAKQISGAAASAKLTSAEVVALSATFASLGIAPERAGGVLVTTFNTIKSAVAANGVELEKFAKLMNMSTQEASTLAQTDMSTFFNTFLTSLNSLDPTSQTAALEQLAFVRGMH